MLGVLLGVAALSKLQALGLLALAGGRGVAPGVASAATGAARGRGAGHGAACAADCGLVVLAQLHAVWRLERRGPFGRHQRAAPQAAGLGRFWLEFRGLRYSFWGLFGWFNILLPGWFYALADGIALLAAAGAAVGTYFSWRALRPAWLRQDATRVRLLLLAWIGLSALLLLYWMNRATGSQGRLIFPALSAMAVWIVVGLDFWLRPLRMPWHAAAWAVFPALLLGATLYSVAFAIPAAYAAPRTVVAVPPGATPVDITYEGVNGEPHPAACG